MTSDKSYLGNIADCPNCHLHYVSVHHVYPEYKVSEHEMWDGWKVMCSNCYYYGPIAKTPRYAIKEWNRHVESVKW